VCGLGLLLLFPIPWFPRVPILSTPYVRVGGGIVALLLMSAAQGMTFVPALPAMFDSAKEPIPHDEVSEMEAGYSPRDKKDSPAEKKVKFIIRYPFHEEEESASFLGGVFQSVSQLASALGPVVGQVLISFFKLTGTEIILGCGLVFICGFLMFCFSGEEASPKKSSGDSEKIENPDDLTPSLSESDRLLVLPNKSARSKKLKSRPKKYVYASTDDSDQDSGEQMHEYGSKFVLGKDVDPG
jgi:hypothetical protein